MRTLYITFRDNAAAEAAILHLLDGADGIGSFESATELGLLMASGATVDAVVARPTAPCRCRGNKQGQYKKTEHFGWWVHIPCNKPSIFIIRDWIKNSLNGHNNLLQEYKETRRKNKELEEAAKPDAPLAQVLENDPVTEQVAASLEEGEVSPT